MFLRLEGPKGEPVIKELEVKQADDAPWPDVVKYKDKFYVFKYENFREGGNGRIRVYDERAFNILELSDKKGA